MNRFRTLLLIFVVMLICGGMSYFGIRFMTFMTESWYEQTALQIAEGIEADCGILLTVDPASTDIYDVAIWSKEYRSSPDKVELITCYGNNRVRWECTCRELP